MAILVYAESWNGSFKKATFEAVSFASQLASKIGEDCIALSIGNNNNNELGKYGAKKIIAINNDSLLPFNNQVYANAIVAVAEYIVTKTIIISNTNNGKSIAPIIS